MVKGTLGEGQRVSRAGRGVRESHFFTPSVNSVEILFLYTSITIQQFGCEHTDKILAVRKYY